MGTGRPSPMHQATKPGRGRGTNHCNITAGEEPGLREQQGTLSLSPFPVDERKTLGGGMDPPKTGYVHRVNINRKSQRHKNSILRGNLEAQDLFISW